MDIQLKNINYFYGKQQVLFDIDLTCKEGETVVFLGPSGAGKSTLLRIFNLLEMPHTGQLNISDQEFNFKNNVADHAIQQLRRNVGMVFQQYNLWPHLSVLQNLIEAPCRVFKMDKQSAIAKAHTLLERLQLTTFAERFPLHLSGGQQQRVAIARALMMAPQILLFDEPTAALDPEITAQVVTIINELAQTGITQLVVTHEIEFAKKIANYIVYMEHGKIIEHGDASHFTQPQTEKFAAYLSH